MLLPLSTIEKNLTDKAKNCEEKIKSIEVGTISLLLHVIVMKHPFVFKIKF